MNTTRNRKGFSIALQLAACLCMTTAVISPTSAQGVLTPEVYPRDSTVAGMTIEEWSAVWWQWVLALPRSRNPIADATGANCAEAQSGPVWFLAGSISSDPVHRTCSIPCGKHVFFPVLNVVAWAPGDCDPTNLDECRRLARDFMDTVGSLRIEFNGVPLENLQDHRHVSAPFPFRVDCDSIFPLDCKIEYTGVSDGYWFMLKPLPPGNHTLKWRGVWGSEQDPIGVQDITYDLTVEPCRFRRGDSDGNGTVNLTDAVATLNFLFNGADPLPCLDAADADDDGRSINITDAVFTLLFLFQGGTVPPAPGPETCGEDPTADELTACSAGC